jgi:replicative DNA helicase
VTTTTTNGAAARTGGLVPPHDLEAEVSVLGAILLDRDAIGRVLDVLAADDFYRENNAAVYRAALGLFREGEPIDNVTLAAALEKAGVLERIGGRAHLALLQESVPTAANVEHYARIVKAKARKRRLITVGGEVTKLGFDAAVEADEAEDQAGQLVLAVAEDQGRPPRTMHELVAAARERRELRRQSGRSLTGIGSGLHDLDRLTGGWKDGELVVIAARPSLGKTSLAMQAIGHAAKEEGLASAVFSLEMGEDQLVDRLLCNEAKVDLRRYQECLTGDSEDERIAGAEDTVAGWPIHIDDRASLDELGLVAAARRFRHQAGIRLVVVDYLQLLVGRRQEDRVQEVSRITRTLKKLARDLAVPVLALSQLNRESENRPGRRPQLSDLRESGEIEQTADVVILLYRSEEPASPTELIVAKHRNGPTGVAKVLFRKECVRFENVESRRDQPLQQEA